MSQYERIIIIGAGSTGSSVAYNLARVTHSEIILVDKRGVASGMTSFSTAIVRTHYSNEIVVKMAFESRRFFEANKEALRFHKTGMLTVVPKMLRSRMEDNVRMLKRLGIREEILDVKEASKRFPWLNFDADEGVSYEPDSGYADPVSTANFFARKATDLGVKFLKEEVHRIEDTQNEAKVVLKSGTEITGTKVILCTNIWTNKLLAQSGLDSLLPLKVSPHPVVIFKRPNSIMGTLPIVNDLTNRDYYKPEGESLLIGGNLRSELDQVDTDPDKPPLKVPFEYISDYSQRISNRIPAIFGRNRISRTSILRHVLYYLLIFWIQLFSTMERIGRMTFPVVYRRQIAYSIPYGLPWFQSSTFYIRRIRRSILRLRKFHLSRASYSKKNKPLSLLRYSIIGRIKNAKDKRISVFRKHLKHVCEPYVFRNMWNVFKKQSLRFESFNNPRIIKNKIVPYIIRPKTGYLKRRKTLTRRTSYQNVNVANKFA